QEEQASCRDSFPILERVCPSHTPSKTLEIQQGGTDPEAGTRENSKACIPFLGVVLGLQSKEPCGVELGGAERAVQDVTVRLESPETIPECRATLHMKN